ncbi:helix-turn-helix domain-containing protein [Saccharibacillus sacchari]|uniref:helix-turn-helix domain-containing protein n=1 Tax=Saccharibacillus sacchari TaxID=456493 RepID=UPI0004B7FD0F|nr:AraC family transcriptional regulator [Saccharibacillus sacchari]
MVESLQISSDLSEKLSYNLPGFPVCVYEGSVRVRDLNAFAYHWHADLEFLLIVEGSMNYMVNDQSVRVEEGNAIFVNSKRLHRGFFADSGNCSHVIVTVHPTLLGEHTSAGKTFLNQKFGLNADDFLHLSAQIAWQQEIINLLIDINEQMKRNSGNLLHLISRCSYLCACIADHIQEKSSESIDNRHLAIIHDMTDYIHRHYEFKLSTDDIAAAGSVCRSRCCELFKKHLRLTPNNYLVQYRIQKSCDLLKETNRPVSEVAIACGFQSASYFAYVFHKHTGHTPQDFRKQATSVPLS